jgi:hypothetical protein
MLLDIAGLHSDEDILESYIGEADDEQAVIGVAALADAEEWRQNDSISSQISEALAASFVDAVLAFAGERPAP